MSRRNNIINLRVTFIGAVEHIRQIEKGIVSAYGLEDVQWIESSEEGIVHLDVSQKDEILAVDDHNRAASFFNTLPRYFNNRSYILDDGPVNRLGLDDIDSLPTGDSRCGYDIMPITNIGRLITSQNGIERYHAVMPIAYWPAKLCKLDKTYPT